MTKAVTLSKEAKALMLTILTKGTITENEGYKLFSVLGLEGITLEIIDKREQVNEDLL